ncbi:MAG: response regulator [Ferruginibacter sp.]
MLPVKHLVIAEDDIDDIFMFKYAFDDICSDLFQLHIATDGVELMKILRNNPVPIAIFLDLNMPRRSGQQCLKEIRSNDKFKDVPVIVLSGTDTESEINNCLEIGANYYYEKPESYQGFKNILLKFTNNELAPVNLNSHPRSKVDVSKKGNQ